MCCWCWSVATSSLPQSCTRASAVSGSLPPAQVNKSNDAVATVQGCPATCPTSKLMHPPGQTLVPRHQRKQLSVTRVAQAPRGAKSHTRIQSGHSPSTAKFLPRTNSNHCGELVFVQTRRPLTCCPDKTFLLYLNHPGILAGHPYLCFHTTGLANSPVTQDLRSADHVDLIPSRRNRRLPAVGRLVAHCMIEVRIVAITRVLDLFPGREFAQVPRVF